MLNNLISNAVKYNRDGGSVKVEIRRDDGTLKVSVTDTGIGLAPEEAAKLFSEFVRIKNEDTIKVLGSGLGLSTVRKLAQLYGGDATVTSTKGAGSTFTVTLHDAVRASQSDAGADKPAEATLWWRRGPAGRLRA